jgi:uncharacterized membrane protein
MRAAPQRRDGIASPCGLRLHISGLRYVVGVEEARVMNGESTQGPSQPIAALTYLLGFVTGIIFLYLEPYNQDEFIRFHARQSIGFSVVWFAVNVIFGVFVAVLPHQLGGLFGFLQGLVNLGFAIFWLFLMYKAYSGERYRIPELSNVIDQVAGPKV